jgi:hypothetical protein
MKAYNDLRTINVNEHVEKKGGLSYLSWAWAVDYLMQEDPTAWWEFDDPQHMGDTGTVMVQCKLHAFGKTIQMHLPVMDNRNNAIKSPDARKISDAMMRCLTKAIACFGIGLYVYAGEDLPEEGEPESIDLEPLVIAIQKAASMDDLKKAYIAGIKQCKTNQDAQKTLEAAKDNRKIELASQANEAKDKQS